MQSSSPFRPVRLPRLRSRLALIVVTGALLSGSGAALAGPQATPPVLPAGRTPTVQDLIAEASARFGVPASWIAEVMLVESRGRANALSPKGAIGLMQVMPETYADMRARYGLGANPWDSRDNVLAGTAYLRLLYDRYGAPGFLVAYNAGPGRWDDYRLRARPLPAETVAYLARLGPVVGGSVLPMPTFAGWAAPRSPLAPPIFVRLASASASVPTSAERERIVRIIDANTSVVRPTDALFVARPRASDTPLEQRSGDDAIIDFAPSRSGPAASSPSLIAPRNPLFPERTNAGSPQ
ncbi:MAG: lytic transglycosylase domain-containing protein [Methylobacteriaceae bacterium]|nr:lytic transglycosylase domain-containing protein [Methylobacteriaceae bacterium]